MDRRQMLASGEDDLEEQQDAFLSRGDAPSTRVTRVQRGGGASAAAAAQEPEPAGEAAAAAPEPEPPAEQGSSVLGEVQERQVAGPPQLPAAPAGGSAGFPAAAHRRLSKFALGRQAHRAAAAQPAQPPAEAAASGGSADEAAGIDAENRRRLAAMQPAEVAEAQREIEGSLSAASLAFLRRRGASGAANPAAAAAASAAAPGAAGSGSSSGGGGGGGGGSAAAGPAQAAAAPQARQPAARKAAPPKAALRDRLAAAAQAQPSTAAGESSGKAATARFAVDGSFAGWQPASGDAAADVLSRDPLRSSGEEGYSLAEACVLARSSLPAQRAAACRLLAAVLARAHPCRRAAGKAGLAAGLSWAEVWAHGVTDARVNVTAALRAALDDPSAAVAVAAAEGIAALLAPAEPDPALGLLPADCPRLAAAALQRPHASAAWEALPVQQQQQQPPLPGEADPAAAAAAEAEAAEGQPDELETAAVDPLAGLLQMQLLPRLRFLLAELRLAPLLPPALRILQACAAAGGAAAAALLAQQQLLRLLLACLDVRVPGTDLWQAAQFAARPAVLRLCRLLCEAGGAAAAGLLLPMGLEQHTRTYLLAGPLPEQPCSGPAATLQLEALQLVRSLALTQRPLVAPEDLYLVLCHALACPRWAALAADARGSGAKAPGERLLLREAAAGWACLAACVRQQPGNVPPGECEAALAAEALAWLAPEQLGPLAQLLAAPAPEHEPSSSGSSSSSSSSSSGSGGGVPELAAAAFAAAAAYLATFLRKFGGATLVACARTRLQSLLLSSGSGSGSLAGVLEAWAVDGLPALLQGGCSAGSGNSSGGSSSGSSRAAARALAAAGAWHSLLQLSASLAESAPPTDPSAVSGEETAWRRLALRLAAALAPTTIAPAAKGWQPADSLAAQRLLSSQLLLAGLLTRLRPPAVQPPETGDADFRLLAAAAALPCAYPPGSETLALAALSHLFSPGAVAACFQRAEPLLGPAAHLPPPAAAAQLLFEGFAAAALGLVPEAGGPGGSGPAGEARNWEGAGSLLPLPPDWLLRGPAARLPEPPAADSAQPGDESSQAGADSPDESPEARHATAVGCGLAFALGLQLGCAECRVASSLRALPAGARLHSLYSLAFRPDAELWHSPLVRGALAALRDLCLSDLPSSGSCSSGSSQQQQQQQQQQREQPREGSALSSSSGNGGSQQQQQELSSSGSSAGWQGLAPEDAAAWARGFGAASFGDGLWGACLAALLRPDAPPPVQVALLEALAEEGALHLLPAPPSAAAAELVPLAVTEAYAELLCSGALGKALAAQAPLAAAAVQAVQAALLSGAPEQQQGAWARRTLRSALLRCSPEALAALLSSAALRQLAAQACGADERLLARLRALPELA